MVAAQTSLCLHCTSATLWKTNPRRVNVSCEAHAHAHYLKIMQPYVHPLDAFYVVTRHAFQVAILVNVATCNAVLIAETAKWSVTQENRLNCSRIAAQRVNSESHGNCVVTSSPISVVIYSKEAVNAVNALCFNLRASEVYTLPASAVSAMPPALPVVCASSSKNQRESVLFLHVSPSLFLSTWRVGRPALAGWHACHS